MSARDVVNSMIGGNHPPAVWGIAIDALVAETLASVSDRLDRLYALEAAGVDNWSGYEYAMELLNGD